MTKTLKCDKPVDLDEARKAKGLPRRKRDDPKATAYELRIRVPTEFQGVMGRKKLSRTVFARNKREELRARIAEFEEDANRMLEDRTTGVGIGVLALPQNQPNAPLYPAGGAPGSRPGALPHFGRPRYLGPPPRARSTAG